MRNYKPVCHFERKEKSENVPKSNKSDCNLQNGKSSKFTFDSSCSSSEDQNSDDQAFIDDQEIDEKFFGDFTTVGDNVFQTKDQPKNAKR